MLESFLQETLSFPQLVGWFGFLIMVCAYQFKTPYSIRLVLAFATACFAMHFYLLDATAAMIIAAVSSVRGFVLSVKNMMKYKKLIVIINLALVYFGVFYSGSFESWIVLLPLIGTTMASFQDIQKKASSMRAISVGKEGLWLIYNVIIGSHGGATNAALVMVSSLVGLWRHRREKAS